MVVLLVDSKILKNLPKWIEKEASYYEQIPLTKTPQLFHAWNNYTLLFNHYPREYTKFNKPGTAQVDAISKAQK